MTAARDTHRNNVVLGAGEVYVDLLDDDGDKTGERYLGDSPAATISVTSETTTVLSSDGPVARELVNRVRSVSRSVGFTLKDSSIANWALFLLGEDEAYADEDIAVADEEIAIVRRGRWYQLGVSDAKPTGVAAIGEAGFAVTYSDNGADTALPAEQYEIDREHARIRIRPDSAALADGATIKIDYTPVASANRRIVKAGEPRQIRCALRYIEDRDAAGEARNAYAVECNLAPAGEIGLKSRETEQQLAFTAAVVDQGGSRPSLFVDGVEL